MTPIAAVLLCCAGSEGIPEPETCAEAYLLKLLIEMRDEAKKGLK